MRGHVSGRALATARSLKLTAILARQGTQPVWAHCSVSRSTKTSAGGDAVEFVLRLLLGPASATEGAALGAAAGCASARGKLGLLALLLLDLRCFSVVLAFCLGATGTIGGAERFRFDDGILARSASRIGRGHVREEAWTADHAR